MNNNTNLKKAASKTAGLLEAVEKEEDIWKINWSDLSIKQKMGQGNFGAVMKVRPLSCCRPISWVLR